MHIISYKLKSIKISLHNDKEMNYDVYYNILQMKKDNARVFFFHYISYKKNYISFYIDTRMFPFLNLLPNKAT